MQQSKENRLTNRLRYFNSQLDNAWNTGFDELSQPKILLIIITAGIAIGLTADILGLLNQ